MDILVWLGLLFGLDRTSDVQNEVNKGLKQIEEDYQILDEIIEKYER